jgi:hypothetical protein
MVLDGPRHDEAERLDVEGLGDEIVSPGAHGFDRRGHASERGDHDDGNIGPSIAELATKLDASSSRHVQVREHDLRLEMPRRLGRLRDARGRRHFMTRASKPECDQPKRRLIIINYQNSR